MYIVEFYTAIGKDGIVLFDGGWMELKIIMLGGIGQSHTGITDRTRKPGSRRLVQEAAGKEGVSMTGVHCMQMWKCHDGTTYYIQFNTCR
jgi:hypothetical protein